jgi:hypothetical protein
MRVARFRNTWYTAYVFTESEWPLTRPDWPIIGTLLSQDIPATNTKTKIHKFISIQKEQILVPIQIESKNTGEGPVSYFFPGGSRIQAQHWAKRGSSFLANLRRKVSWAESSLSGLSTHPTDRPSTRGSFFYNLTVYDARHPILDPRYTHSRGFFVEILKNGEFHR